MVAGLAKCRVFILPLLLPAMMLAPSSASAQLFVTVDVPGATLTSATAINNVGQIAGYYARTKYVSNRGQRFGIGWGQIK
jgi:hypothetical protein